MDDNELDRLFGYDGGDDDSGEDDSEHLQIVDSKEKSHEASETGDSEEKDSSDVKETEASDEADKESDPDNPESEQGDSDNNGEDGSEGEKTKDGETDENGETVEAGGRGSSDDKEPSEEKESDKGSDKDKKKRKRKVRLSGFGIAVIVLFTLIVAAILLFLFLPVFRVREVTVEGNVELTDEEVLNEVGLKYNAHLMRGVSGNLLDIIRFNYGKTEERIRRENPYIADITISVKLPSEVKITVKERRKIAYVSTPDGYIALDRYGTVLEIISGKARQDVRPIVYGITVESAKLGGKVSVKDENSYKKSIVVLGSILSADNATIGDKFNMFEHTTEVRIIPSGYIFLTVYTESGKPVQVKLNSTDKITEKMSYLLYLFNANAFDQVTVKGTLDMTGDEYIFNPSKK